MQRSTLVSGQWSERESPANGEQAAAESTDSEHQDHVKTPLSSLFVGLNERLVQSVCSKSINSLEVGAFP